MDASTKLIVKFVNGHEALYLKIVGKAPNGLGSNKSGFEVESSFVLLLSAGP